MSENKDVEVLLTMTVTLTSLIGWLKGKGLWEEASKSLCIDEQWKNIGNNERKKDQCSCGKPTPHGAEECQ